MVQGACQSEDPKSAVVVGLLHNSLKSLIHWKWLNLWLTVLTGVSDLDFVLAFHSSPLWMNGAALRLTNSINAFLEDKELMKLPKCFPIYHVSQMLGGPSLRLGDTKECRNIPPSIGWGGNDTGRLVMWEFPLWIDSTSWKSLVPFIQFISFCNSCTLPDNSKIVFWSSMSFCLAIVSKVELWNFRNYSISVRICWRGSRNSNFCRLNCPCKSRRSSSARAAWSSWWLTFRDIPR